MSLYVIAYDVTDDKRRKKVAQVLAEYGERVQKSVFEARLEPWQLQKLKRQVGALLAKADEFDIYPIDEHGKRNRIRWQRKPSGHPSILLLPHEPYDEFTPMDERDDVAEFPVADAGDSLQRD